MAVTREIAQREAAARAKPSASEIRPGVYRYTDGSEWDSGTNTARPGPGGSNYALSINNTLRAAAANRAAPDSNPKTADGMKKPSMAVVPPVALLHMIQAFQDGSDRRGAFNWREQGISTSIYYAAAMRHLMKFFDGEDIDPDSEHGAHHLGCAMASMAILLDAASIGKLNDDRPPKGAFATVCKEMTRK